MTPGELLLENGFAMEAFPFLRHAARIEPTPGSLNNLAVAYRQLAEFKESLRFSKLALEIDSLFAPAWNNIAMVHEDLGDFESSLDVYAGLHEANPTNQNIAMGYAYCLLRSQQFEKAWPLWELGRFCRSWAPVCPAADLPIWDGSESLQGRRILVIREGGYGDGIMFARWLPEMVRRGARVTYMVWPRMMTLFDQGVIMSDENIAQIKPGDFDCQISLMSLPHALGMKSLADIPRCPQIWESRHHMGCIKWESRIGPHFRNLRVGLCWRAEENSIARRIRSIPAEVLGPLSKVPNVRWFSLCPHGAHLNRDDDFTSPVWVNEVTADTRDWNDTAAAISCLNIVVTVDTAVAHLACAMRKPTIILLPLRRDWKWFNDTDKTPWYPTAELLCQDDPVRWDSVIERLVKKLS